jgi:hypothetical protein
MENRSLDKQGQLASIEKMQAEGLRVEQRTGVFKAAGPGWVSTVRRGGAENPLEARGFGGVTRPAQSGANDQPQFSYLFVEFQLQIAGNLHQHTVEFQRQVRAVYGPVAGWDGTLDVSRPESLGEQGVLLNCQRLALAELPGSAPNTTTLEMEATGDTVVEGKGFTARAPRISYVDEKQLLVLEGDGRRDAELTRQTRIGGPQSKTAAKKFMYWRFDNRTEIIDGSSLELNQLDGLKLPGK